MAEVKVKMSRKLTSEECSKICDIMRNSQCPNESLIDSIAGCEGFQDGCIVVQGNDDYHVLTLFY